MVRNCTERRGYQTEAAVRQMKTTDDTGENSRYASSALHSNSTPIGEAEEND